MPLPFGLKLKRSRRYTVSSKSCLVTRIQLLNSEFVEFMLSVESTGQECLEGFVILFMFVICSHFEMNQLPLPPYRYQYYLQLKKDVLEGRIPCSIEQAIRLAGLAVQADFGDFNCYDSQEFLQKFVLFPIGWIQDERVLEEATQRVALLYQNYRGLPAREAEVLYMQEVEKMEGYGQESTPAKDSQGTDILLGACLDGIFVKRKNGRPPLVFKWNEINNMTHNKSFFALELANKEESEDMETSKYVCRMCLARHKFYKINKSSLQTQPTAVNPVHRRSSTRMSLPKPPACMMPPPQMPYNGHFTEPYTSSQVSMASTPRPSLDRSPLEYGNSGVVNGSVYSAHSTSSLTNPQHYMQPSPMSSNPSITGSNITRPDYVPSHRHSALIPPSYRATPDYNTVMRQKNQGGGMVHAHEHRQSLSMRNLNIGNSYAYSRPDPLVYSLPEIRGEHGGGGTHHYPFHLNSSFHSPSPYSYPTKRRPVAGAVSVPELINVRLQQAQEYPAANIMRTQVYRPPPLYSYGTHPWPANSTPALSHHLYVSSSNPDLITMRRVHHSVQTFQEDSLPVAHSLQEVSEPLFMAGPPQHHPHQQNAHKRNSIEIASLAYSLEGMRVNDTPLLVPHGPSSSSQLKVFLERTKSEDGGEGKEHVRYGHKKSLSDATMLVHSSEEEEFEDESGHHTPQSHDNKQKAKKDFIKKRPVSDVPAGKNPIDGLPPAGMKKRVELKKMGPLKVAALNGLTLSRLPLHEGGKEKPETSNDERCKELQQRMEQGMVFQEYEQVAKRRPAGDCSIAQLPESGERNRFQDVLPYDDTRVELVPSKENNTGYINASHIRIMVGGDEWRYIASQGPLSNTCQDFWQMVWEQGVAIIAMVTAEEEGGREKSFCYWPRLGSRHNTVTYGHFKITTRFRMDSGCYATTGLMIKHVLTGQEHTVWHLQYTDWPDHGCPEDFKGFLSYLEEIQSVRRHTNSTSDPKNTNLPVLVHCSAGVGRSGVVILSEVMIACLEHNEMLDIPTVLNMLRQQRMMMVQTISQYSFIYKVLIQFLRNSRLI
uniref:Tyrosine-protein phosphatase non-receptor type n=1 Tax=Oncorhynchus tshawytscha TaxID=74940 RepID=A0AAZ3QQN1_ONCTS